MYAAGSTNTRERVVVEHTGCVSTHSHICDVVYVCMCQVQPIRTYERGTGAHRLMNSREDVLARKSLHGKTVSAQPNA